LGDLSARSTGGNRGSSFSQGIKMILFASVL
jgi:hypothetical protein